MNVLRELWKLLDRRERRQWLALQVISIGMALATLASVAAAAPFFSAIASPSLIHNSEFLAVLSNAIRVTDEDSLLMALGITFIGVVLLANMINLFGSLAMNRYAYRIGNRFSSALFREYLRRGLAFHAASDSATLFNNVVWEVNHGTTGVVQSAFLLGANLTTALLIIISLIVVNPLIAMSVFGVIGGGYATVYLLVRRRLLRNSQHEGYATATRTRIATVSFAAIKEITLSSSHEFFGREFDASCNSIARFASHNRSIAQAPRWILECLALATLAAISLMLVAGSPGSSRIGQLAFIAFAAYRLLPALQQIFQAAVKLRGDEVAFTRVAADLREAVLFHNIEMTSHSTCEGRSTAAISLRDVTFRYSSDRPAAVRNITLRIPARVTVGLVGASGSGKTTLGNLIAGLLIPSAGSIEIDGVVLDESSRTGWQSGIGYVPQDVCLLDASIAENIAFGLSAAEIDRERLRLAAQRANLHGFVERLPLGYDELLGEHGIRVSGGQKQRIGIARALYRNASLLIFDEATSALDAATEAKILETVDSLRGEYTILLITHRATVLEHCELIFQLEDGMLSDCRTCGDAARFRHRGRLRTQGANKKSMLNDGSTGP